MRLLNRADRFIVKFHAKRYLGQRGSVRAGVPTTNNSNAGF